MKTNSEKFFKISPEIQVFPILNKSLLWSIKLKEFLFENNFDAIAVDLPHSIKDYVIEGVKKLPEINCVTYLDEDNDYILVPIDPSEPVISAVKFCVEENIDLHFVDSSRSIKNTHLANYPDAYSIRFLDPAEYFMTMLPSLIDKNRLNDFDIERHWEITANLFKLSLTYNKILYITDFNNFLYIKEHFQKFEFKKISDFQITDIELLPIRREQLYFVLGELPITTYLYISNNFKIFSDNFKYEDIIKELVLRARKNYIVDFPDSFISITKLNNLLKFARNYSIRKGKLFPDLFSLLNAAKKTVDDDFVFKLVQVSKYYPYNKDKYDKTLKLLPEIARKSDEKAYRKYYNYFDSSPKEWHDLELNLKRKSFKKLDKTSDELLNTIVSYPPEDIFLEKVRDELNSIALNYINEKEGRVEKFSGSLEDGINLRETLRNLNNGLYVNVDGVKKSIKDFDTTIIIFDQYNDNLYPEKHVMFAEHHNESTIGFYSTPFTKYQVHEGIYKAKYGGVFLLYPPVLIPQFWNEFEFRENFKTLADKLVFAACEFSQKKDIVFVGNEKPTKFQKQMFEDYHKNYIYIPLSKLSPKKREKLQTFHILKDKSIRRVASKFINLD